MRSLDLMVPTGDLDGVPGAHDLAVTVHLPDADPTATRVYVAFPGGGYGRRYFDITAKPSYSQAEYHTDRGAIFVAVDHLGVGGSSMPDPFDLTFENIAAANHQVTTTVLDGLRRGTLIAGVGGIDIADAVGMGQSMGGCLLTVQQANHQTFDAVAFLGWSGTHTTFPAPDGGRNVHPVPPRGFDLRPMAADLANSPVEVEHFRFCFHWPDEDPELLEADLASYQPFTEVVRGDAVSPWGSATVPPCALTMLGEHVVAEDAARITVPVLVAVGERDVVGDPVADRLAYTSSPEVSIVVISRMAHMHNFARTRARLWAYIDGFGR